MRRGGLTLGRLSWIALGGVVGALVAMLLSHIPPWIVGIAIGAYVAALVGPPRFGMQRRRDHPDDRWPSGPRDLSGRPVRPPHPVGGPQATAELEVPRAEQIVEVAQALIIKGKERGTLSSEDILQAFPVIAEDPHGVARVAATFTALGIDITDAKGLDAA